MALAQENIGWGTAEHWMRMQASYALLFVQVHQTLTITNDLLARHRGLSLAELQHDLRALQDGSGAALPREG